MCWCWWCGGDNGGGGGVGGGGGGDGAPVSSRQEPLATSVKISNCSLHFVTSCVMVLGGVKIYLLCHISSFRGGGLGCPVNQIARRREVINQPGPAAMLLKLLSWYGQEH